MKSDELLSSSIWGDKPTSRGYREETRGDQNRTGPHLNRSRGRLSVKAKKVLWYMKHNSGRNITYAEIAHAVGLEPAQVRNSLVDLTWYDPRVAEDPYAKGEVYYLTDAEYAVAPKLEGWEWKR